MPKRDLRLANAAGVVQQALAVEPRPCAAHHKAVRHAAGGEAAAPEAAHFDRAVGQFVVVLGAVVAKAVAVHAVWRQAGSHLPAGGGWAGHELQRVRLVFLAEHLQAQAGGVKEAASVVQKSGAHRGVQRVHGVLQFQRLAGHRSGLPAVFVELLERHRLPSLRGAQALQVLGKLAHQVAARNPHRQADALVVGRLVNAQRDGKQVGLRAEHRHGVVQPGRRWGAAAGAAGGCLGAGGAGRAHRAPAPTKQLSAATVDKRKRSVSQCCRPARTYKVRSAR